MAIVWRYGEQLLNLGGLGTKHTMAIEHAFGTSGASRGKNNGDGVVCSRLVTVLSPMAPLQGKGYTVRNAGNFLPVNPFSQ